MPLRRYPFAQWDVFTSEALSGNPLAVFPDARGLAGGAMQKLARETNLSETVFLFPREEDIERERGVLARIFTPEKELPFAGHPSLGAANVLRAAGRPSPIALDLPAGRIEIHFEGDFGEMIQPAPSFIASLSPADIAEPLGLTPADFADRAPPQIVSTGLPYLIVPLRSRERVSAYRAEWNLVAPFLRSLEQQPSLYLITTDARDDRLHVRCLDPEREDPATGSAAGCAAAWMVRHRIAAPDERVTIAQGAEILRPSTLYVRAGISEGEVTNVRVGGYAVEVLRGEYLLHADS